MRSTQKTTIALSLLVLLLAGSALTSRAVDITCAYEAPRVHLYVPGLYYTASVARAENQNGPYTYLGGQWYGCTEACDYFDPSVLEGRTYWYRMTLIPQTGPLMQLGPVQVTTPGLPARMLQSIASPNPFPDEVSVRFHIPALLALQKTVPVRMRIVDATGRTIRTLTIGDMAQGDRVVHWDGRNENGQKAPSGIYLYQLEVGSRRETGRITKVN